MNNDNTNALINASVVSHDVMCNKMNTVQLIDRRNGV
jgi:hypothetical protein